MSFIKQRHELHRRWCVISDVFLFFFFNDYALKEETLSFVDCMKVHEYTVICRCEWNIPLNRAPRAPPTTSMLLPYESGSPVSALV